MKIYLLVVILIISSCSSKNQSENSIQNPKNNIVEERNLILSPTSVSDQNAAELFDLGTAPANGASKIVLNISNTTTNILTIDTNALATKFSMAGNRWAIGTTNTCNGPLNAGSTCRIQIVLNNNSTTALEDYTQPVESNLITKASPTKTNPTIVCPTGFSVAGATCIPSNPQFGKMIFTGQKAADVAINTVPMLGSIRFSTLAETYIMSSGSMTKRFYMGNPLQTGNTIPVPAVIAPPNGTISKNTCTSLTGLPPLKACFFEVTYNYDVTKPSLSEQITFGTPAPLNGVSLNTTGVAIALAITNQPPVVPVEAASFAQVSKITDLSSSTQQQRIYVTNTGSGVSDLTKVSIPAPFIIAKTSCSTSQSVGSTCFIDLKVDTTKTANITGVAPSISYGSSVAPVSAGQPVTPGQTGSCKPGFSFVNNSCVSSNITQSCSIANGTGTQSSTDGGSTFGLCTVVTCNPNYSAGSNNTTCNPIICDSTNSGIANANTVSGDLVAGCNVLTCMTGYTVIGNSCVSSNISQSCTVATGNGIGTKYSTDAGQTFGSCQLASCGANYEVSGDKQVCLPVPCSIANAGLLNVATVSGDKVAGCSVVSCSPSFSLVGGVCVTSNKSQSCTGTNGSGIQYSLDGGVTYGSCQLNACSNGYTLLGGSCLTSNVDQSCSVALGSGVGIQHSVDAGQHYGACQLNSCGLNYEVSADKLSCQPVACNDLNSGLLNVLTYSGDKVVGCSVATCQNSYTLVGGICLTSNIDQSCSVTQGQGSGLMHSLDAGLTWGSCQLTSCGTNYEVSADKLSCQPIACTQANTGLLHALTFNGDKVTGCTANTCESQFVVKNGACASALVVNSCTTTIGGGSGTATSNDGGSTFGQCQLTSCSDPKYEVSADLKSCQPIACSMLNTSFLFSSTVSGDLVSGCSIASCQPNYSLLANNSCQLTNQSRSCQSLPLNSTSGTEYSTDGGVTWGSCQISGCSANMVALNNQCSAPLSLDVLPSIKISNAVNYPISGSCTNVSNGTTINIQVGSINSITVCSTGLFATNIDVSSIADSNSVAISSSITDSFGNSSSVSSNVIKDTIAPSLSLNALSTITSLNQSSYSISGTCSENGNQVSLSVGTIQAQTNCSSGTFTTNVNVSAIADSSSVVIAAQLTDSVGNITNVSSNVLKNTVIPTLTNSQSNLTSTGSPIVLSGTCSGTLPITFTEAGNTSNTSINCNNGTYSTSYVVSTGTNGTKTITLSETDTYGNSISLNVNYTLNTTPVYVGPTAFKIACDAGTTSKNCLAPISKTDTTWNYPLGSKSKQFNTCSALNSNISSGVSYPNVYYCMSTVPITMALNPTGSSAATVYYINSNTCSAPAAKLEMGTVNVSDLTTYCSSVSPNIQSLTMTGGTITCPGGGTPPNCNSGTYKVHTFTTSGNLTVSGATAIMDYVIVGAGGGGGGGDSANNLTGGGGGAGGYLTGGGTNHQNTLNSPSLSLVAGTYPVVVGAGGAGGYYNLNGSNGGDSSFSGMTAFGGGGGGGAGGSAGKAGNTGGCGGGGGAGLTTGGGIGGVLDSAQCDFAAQLGKTTATGGTGGVGGGVFNTAGSGYLISSFSGVSTTYSHNGFVDYVSQVVAPNGWGGYGAYNLVNGFFTGGAPGFKGNDGVVIIRYLVP